MVLQCSKQHQKAKATHKRKKKTAEMKCRELKQIKLNCVCPYAWEDLLSHLCLSQTVANGSISLRTSAKRAASHTFAQKNVFIPLLRSSVMQIQMCMRGKQRNFSETHIGHMWSDALENGQKSSRKNCFASRTKNCDILMHSTIL